MRARARVTTIVLALVVVAGMSSTSGGQDAPGLPAQVGDLEPPIRTEKYRYTDFGRSASARDDRTGKATFRVVERTGNCCENYITIDQRGTLYDLGGSYVNFTADDGKTWKQVKPIEPLVNGEGTIAVAPGGDIVGVEWDPYSGDHLLAYKYDAEARTWEWLETPLHTPFYDRPWLTVIPGPFDIGGQKVPYVTFVDGYPHMGLYLFSTDGLTYTPTHPAIDHQSTPDAISGWLPTAKRADMDWIQPNSQSPIIPLAKGFGLVPPAFGADSWSLFDPKTQKWTPYEPPKGLQLQGRLLMDSRGWIHNLIEAGQFFEYRISTNGGRSWKSVKMSLPAGQSTQGGNQTDFRVNAKVGIAAAAFHTNKAGTGDGDLVYTIDISKPTPRVKRLYEIGRADVDAAAGLGQQIRFDFETVAIFPDGRIAVSFLDSTTGPVQHLAEAAMERLGPALAIEVK